MKRTSQPLFAATPADYSGVAMRPEISLTKKVSRSGCWRCAGDHIVHYSDKRMSKERDTSISKCLTWLLRYGALEEGLQVQSDGSVELQALLRVPAVTKLGISAFEVERVCATSSGNGGLHRFALRDAQGKRYIRCTYAHGPAIVAAMAKAVGKKPQPSSLGQFFSQFHKELGDQGRIDELVKTLQNQGLQVHLLPHLREEDLTPLNVPMFVARHIVTQAKELDFSAEASAAPDSPKDAKTQQEELKVPDSAEMQELKKELDDVKATYLQRKDERNAKRREKDLVLGQIRDVFAKIKQLRNSQHEEKGDQKTEDCNPVVPGGVPVDASDELIGPEAATRTDADKALTSEMESLVAERRRLYLQYEKLKESTNGIAKLVDELEPRMKELQVVFNPPKKPPQKEALPRAIAVRGGRGGRGGRRARGRGRRR